MIDKYNPRFKILELNYQKSNQYIYNELRPHYSNSMKPEMHIQAKLKAERDALKQKNPYQKRFAEHLNKYLSNNLPSVIQDKNRTPYRWHKMK
jgi:hypothetical protein